MYYLIEQRYVGPETDHPSFFDADTIEIWDQPARAKMSGEIRIQGWCGTTNDWYTSAHGEYATIEAARAAISEIVDEIRSEDAHGNAFESDPSADHVLEIYKPGRFEPMTPEATGLWAWEAIQNDIDANTRDADLVELVQAYEKAVNAEGYTLDSGLIHDMRRYRDELKESED